VKPIKRQPEIARTVAQPWRGLFGVVITLAVTLGITSAFDMATYMGIFTLWAMPMVPILLIMCIGWGGQFPPTGRLPRPWRGFLLIAFQFVVGTVVYLLVRYLMSGGVPQPFSNVYEISTVIVVFFVLIAFGMWPFARLPRPLNGFLVMIAAYLIMWGGLKLFNFSLLSFPTGVNPSPAGAVPFYANGGPMAAFAVLAPMGPFAWESALACWFWSVLFLLVFDALDMWPFHRAPGLMKQPVKGVVVTLSSLALAVIAFTIGVGAMKLEPLRFLLDGICFLFGLLMLQMMFQSLPGRKLKQPAGGLLNFAISIVIGVIGFYIVRAFCNWHFGEAMQYPDNIFAIANIMLGLAFPSWAVYSTFFDFWPLPPTPPLPGDKSG
jgi:hypothetical protein